MYSNTNFCRFPRLVLLAVFVIVCLASSAWCQECLLTCTIEDATGNTALLTFGFAADGLRGVDGLDVPVPPSPPESALYAYLAMDLSGVPIPDRWSHDIRPWVDFYEEPGLYHVEFWHMHVDVAEAGEITFQLDITGDEIPPLHLRLLGPGGLYEDVGVQGNITVTVSPSAADFYWEVMADREVEVEARNWSEMKALFR